MLEQARKAIVIGATGMVGQQLVTQLLEQKPYTEVVTLVREPREFTHPKLKQVVVNWDELEKYESAFHQADDLFCCLGTTIKKAGSQAAFRKVDLEYPITVAKIAERHGIKQFIGISSMGANAKSRVFYSRTKGQFEEEMKKTGIPSVHFVRPSLLIGDRKENRTGEKIGEVLLGWLDPLLKLGKGQNYRAIPGSLVAAAMIRIALREQTGIHVYSNQKIREIAEAQPRS
ncbi:oxidoreductase [Paenibacillus sp. Marseille-Q7038]